MHCFCLFAHDCKWLVKSQKALSLPDITSFSRMQKIEVTGASDLALLFYTKGVLYSIKSTAQFNTCYHTSLEKSQATYT